MGARPSLHLVPGEVIDVVIEKGVYRGLGLGRHEGQVIFVPRALPGERLSVRVVSVDRGYARGVALARIEPSPFERPSPCGFFPRCGGCAYQHLDRGAELRMKEDILRESLRRAGVAWDGAIDVVPSPETGWRTRATFHVSMSGGQLNLGLYEEGSRRVVDLDGECLQVSPALNRALDHLRRVLVERVGLAAGITDVHLAESLDGRELVLWVDGDLTAAEAQSLGAATASAPWLTGMGVTVGPPGSRRELLIRGTPYVHAVVLGVRLRSHGTAFFQANRFLVESLAAEVARLLPGEGPLLDLYGGGGLFGLTAGRTATEVVVVESSELAAADAEANAEAAGSGRVRVVLGSVESALERRRQQAGERIVLDPPRAGAGKRVVAAIAARQPEAIAYVSCDPTTLARDLAVLGTRGYRVDSLRLFDLFPATLHLETVARLVPA
jgi:tRNA/tmRNA/rRNA uracil-C5-methylase (TrmA/RlmC/RlmD family)